MLLKNKKPKTPGQRHQLLIDKSLLYNNYKIKKILFRVKKNAGRNNKGKITIRHHGGGARKIIRLLNWNTNTHECVVIGFEYDPNRSAFLARVFDIKNKAYYYTLATKFLVPGSKITIGDQSKDIRLGNRMPLLNIPAGSIINAVSTTKKLKPIFATAAGTSCQLLQKGVLISKIRIPSGEIKYVPSKSFATIGSLSNDMHNLQKIGKAGKNRHKGVRPTVRGVAMNPVDHPHGGGGGKPSVTPWGKPTKGKPTKK